MSEFWRVKGQRKVAVAQRIARSLVTILALTLIQTIGAPVLTPSLTSPQAQAANSALIQTNLTLDANATAGANDFTSSMTLVGPGSPAVPPQHTNSGVGYYTFDATYGKYAYANRNFADGASISIFAWVYPTAAGVIMGHSGQPDPYTGYRLTLMDYTAGGNFEVGLYTSGGAKFITSTTLTTPLNNWYYVGLTYGGNILKGYINGQEFGSRTDVSWLTSSSDYFHVGALQGGTCFGTCSTPAAQFRFGELSIYTSQLSGSDVTSNYLATQTRFAPTVTNPSNASIYTNRTATFSGTCSGATSNNGTTACAYQWQRSIDSGSTWSDIAGATSSSYTPPVFATVVTGYQYRVRAYDPGTGSPTSALLSVNSAAATLTVTQPPGSDTDTALVLGANKYAWRADSPELDILSGITIEAWVFQDSSNSNWNMVVNKENSYEIGTIGGTWYFGLQGTTWAGVNTNVPSQLGRWQHIALTRAANSSTAYFYLNGQLAWSGTADGAGSGNLNNSTNPFTIGGRSTDGVTFTSFFNGKIDELRIFNSARSQSEIAADMHAYGPITTSNLALYYDFNEGSSTTLYNRVSGSSTLSDLTIVGSPSWSDIKTTDTTTLSAYTIVKFPRSYLTSSGGWRVPAGVTSVSALTIAGGGGGGSRVGGGGGAGGYIYSPKIFLTPNAVEKIQIGEGGLGAQRPAVSEWQGHDGQDSQFGTRTAAVGGGGGGGYNTSSNTDHVGRAGGSGGGAAAHLSVAGTWAAGVGLGTSGQGNNGGSGFSGTSGYYPGGGGGGAGGIGGTSTSSTVMGDGGLGNLDPLSGSGLCLAGGGGGGVGTSYAGSTGGIGGGCTGGTTTAGTGSEGQVIPSPATANSGSGGGGAGYVPGNANDVAGGNGGSGVIIIRWITASKPTYTAPSNAYLNVGQSATFSTNVAVDSATALLTRTFRWESTTGGAGGTYSVIKSGTGAANASYSWTPTDTSTSGSQYLYRVIVTDSDTAGLFIQDTSTPVFATINRTLAFTGSSTINKTVGRSKSETFTVTFGTPTYRFTLLPNMSSLSIDSSTAGFAILKISDTITVGTYTVTLTVIDSVSATASIPLTIKVATPPTFSAGELVDSGTVLYLDPGNSNTYNGSGTSLGDLSGQGLSTSLVANTTGRIESSSSNTCSAPTYSTDNYGILTFTSPQCGYVSNLGLLRSYTVETWVKRSGSQTGEGAIVATPYSGTGKQVNIAIFWTGTNEVVAGIYPGTGSWIKTPIATIADNTWVRLTATFNESTKVLSLFVDSETVSSRTVNVTVTWDESKIDGGLLIARKWGANDYFKGSIGYLRIYNRVLTGAELLQNYNATKGRFLTGQLATTHFSKYGTTVTDTFTVASGTPSYTYSYVNPAPNRVNLAPGFTYETSTSSALTLTVIPQLSPGTYYDTFTATDSNGASTFLLIKAIIAKADTLTIGFDTPTVVTYNGQQPTSFPKPLIRGLQNSDSVTVPTRFSSARYPLSATVPVNADTYTVSAAAPTFTVGLPTLYEAVVYETSTLTILQARQNPLTFSKYGAVVGSPFTIYVSGGTDTGTITASIAAGSTASGCSVNNFVLTASSSSSAYCNVTVTKAGTQNYLTETATASIYFLLYEIYQPSPPASSGPTIAIVGSTPVAVINTAPPNITTLSTYSAPTGTSIEINGSGFSASGLEVKFWRNKVPATMSVVSDSKITATIPAGTTSGRIIITTVNGSVASDFTLQITS